MYQSLVLAAPHQLTADPVLSRTGVGADPLLTTVAAVQSAAVALTRISYTHVPNQPVPAMRVLAHRTALDLARLLEVLDPDASLRRTARGLRAKRADAPSLLAGRR